MYLATWAHCRGYMCVSVCEKSEIWSQSHIMCSFLTYLHFLRGSCIPSDNFRNTTLHTLEQIFFGKLLCCNSKYYYSLADASLGKGETRGLLKKFWWEFCLGKGAFLARINPRNPWIWFEFKKYKSVPVWKHGNFVKIAFWRLHTPPFWNRVQNMDFCDLVFEINREQGLYRAPTTFKRPKIVIIDIFS